jgi:DNA-binding response OmpR family regulator
MNLEEEKIEKIVKTDIINAKRQRDILIGKAREWMRILLVEDSGRLADALVEALGRANYQVDVASDGQTGYEYAISGIYDLLILDLMLPQMNGYEVLEALRRGDCQVPVIILSAKSELEDKIQGFAAGADDYVTKPFEIRELLMRIRAVLRRKNGPEREYLTAGSLCLDRDTAEMRNTENGKNIQVAATEMHLLEMFLMNLNQVLEKEQITTKVWGYDSNTEYNNVEVYVSFLRKKLKYLRVNVRIRAVRGIGYVMEVTDDQ